MLESEMKSLRFGLFLSVQKNSTRLYLELSPRLLLQNCWRSEEQLPLISSQAMESQKSVWEKSDKNSFDTEIFMELCELDSPSF
jgi:hypothetical protein